MTPRACSCLAQATPPPHALIEVQTQECIAESSGKCVRTVATPLLVVANNLFVIILQRQHKFCRANLLQLQATLQLPRQDSAVEVLSGKI